MDILLLKYNLYFNRQVKYIDTPASYLINSGMLIKGVDFKDANYLSTSLVVSLDNPVFTPDYLLALQRNPYYDPEEEDSQEYVIVSRWFVTEVYKIRGKDHIWGVVSSVQYRLSLKRDSIADNLEPILTAPFLAERGPISPDSPLVFNPEGFSFNQIKMAESLLKDESGTPWIVGYFSRDTDDDSYITASVETKRVYPNVRSLGLTFNDDADLTKGGYLYSLYSVAPECTIDYPIQKYMIKADYSNGTVFTQAIGFKNEYALKGGPMSTETMSDAMRRYGDAAFDKKNTCISYVKSNYGYVDEDVGFSLASLNGSIVYDSTDGGHYYRIEVYESDVQYELKSVDGDMQNLFQLLRSFALAAANDSDGFLWDNNPSYYDVSVGYRLYRVNLTEVSLEGEVRVKIPTSRNNLTDAPFDMFAMPFTLNNLAIAQAMITQPPAAGKKKKFYDVQILPFCPFQEFVGGTLSDYTASIDYVEIEQNISGTWTGTGQYMLFPLRSSGSFTIDFTISESEMPAASFLSDEGIDADPEMIKKISSETEFIRLCSPNYSSAFSFSVSKNGGTVSGFRVDFTYRPYMPYIRVSPILGGIYGSYIDDARGLILGGDYSIDMTSDAWTEYITANKNYEAVFNTSIKTMDTMHELERGQKIAGVLMGSAAAGAGAAGMSGNIFAGIAAGVVSAAAGTIDIAMNEARFNAQRAQAVANFKYSIGSVKALPDTLTKVTAYNVNNKYFPVLELYAATREEVMNLKAYLEEFNYSLGYVTTIGSILENRRKNFEYVKGKFIRIPGFESNNAVAKDAYSELEQGVYFGEVNI